MSQKVIVLSPQPEATLRTSVLACGEAYGGIAVRGKLVLHGGNGHPRVEVPGFAVSLLPQTDLTAFWMLLFDLTYAPHGEYSLLVLDEWTGEQVGDVRRLRFTGRRGFDPLLDQIVPDPSQPLPAMFGVTVQSGTQTPSPSLSLDHVKTFTPVLVRTYGTNPYYWVFQCTVSGWDGTSTNLEISQTGVGSVGSGDLTFQAGV